MVVEFLKWHYGVAVEFFRWKISVPVEFLKRSLKITFVAIGFLVGKSENVCRILKTQKVAVTLVGTGFFLNSIYSSPPCSKTRMRISPKNSPRIPAFYHNKINSQFWYFVIILCLISSCRYFVFQICLLSVFWCDPLFFYWSVTFKNR